MTKTKEKINVILRLDAPPEPFNFYQDREPVNGDELITLNQFNGEWDNEVWIWDCNKYRKNITSIYAYKNPPNTNNKNG